MQLNSSADTPGCPGRSGVDQSNRGRPGCSGITETPDSCRRPGFPSRAVRHGTDLAAHFLTSERSRRSRLGLCRLVASGTYTPARIRSCLQYAPLIARQPRGSGALHVSRRHGTKICNVSGIHSLTDRVDRASRSAVNSKITYSND